MLIRAKGCFQDLFPKQTNLNPPLKKGSDIINYIKKKIYWKEKKNVFIPYQYISQF